jgi:DNA-binding transcriptional regulator YhcF (GntR family)
MPRTAEIAAVLRSRILAGVHLGQATGVERLPSVRALALAFDADHRTITGALRRLSDEGIVEFRPRSGIYVALPQAWPHLPDGDDEWLVDSVLAAFRRRVTPRELASRVLSITRPVRRALCVESTAEHRRILCDEVHKSYGFESSELDVADLAGSQGVLAEADIIVTTMFHMVEVTKAAREAMRPAFMMTIEAETGRRIAEQLAAGEVYFIVTDCRISEKIDVALKATGLAPNARTFMAGVDDPETIPDAAPVYVFPSALPLIEGTSVMARATVLRYEFPVDVARHLLRWLIRNGN